MTKKYRIHIMGKKFQSIGKMTFSRNFFLYQDFEFWQVAKFIIAKYKKLTNQIEKMFCQQKTKFLYSSLNALFVKKICNMTCLICSFFPHSLQTS